MADKSPSTITYFDPNTNYTVAMQIPDPIVAMWQWLHEHTYLPEYPAPAPPGTTEIGQPKKRKYDDAVNVLVIDALEKLMPDWIARYQTGIAAEKAKNLQDEVDAQKAAVAESVQAGIAGLTVVSS